MTLEWEPHVDAKDRVARPAGTPATTGTTRRQFLHGGLGAVIAFAAVGCTSHKKKSGARGPSTTIIPDSGSGFGGRIDAGPLDSVRAAIASKHAPYYLAEARAYVSAFPTELAGRARHAYPSEAAPQLAAGVIVLYQRCTHLGCRVPWCGQSQYFECACHGAKFDRVGERRAGPAPRGMDIFAASIEHDHLVIDTGNILAGLPAGTNTTHQSPAGPYCV
jgi:cytochrome b6-f complex iron-sulfur subunit